MERGHFEDGVGGMIILKNLSLRIKMGGSEKSLSDLQLRRCPSVLNKSRFPHNYSLISHV